MVPLMRVAALVLAAGRGERLGAERPKAFVQVAGKALLVHALSAVAAAQEIDQVIPVLGPADELAWGELAAELDSIPKLSDPVSGGAERQDSMAAGLAALPPDVSHVAVHDAARPLVRPEDVDRVVRAAKRTGAAILAVPVRDTIKRVQGGQVVETPPRSEPVSRPRRRRSSQVGMLARGAGQGGSRRLCIGTDDAADRRSGSASRSAW